MMGGGGIATLIILVLAMVFGVDPRPLLQNMPQGGGVAVEEGQPIDPANDPQAELVVFSKKILADTEDTWSQIFQNQVGKRYQPAQLVLFSDSVQSGCGGASASVGPFYCPMDQRVYLDLTFFDEMKRKFQAPGDFAMAYVIAHEIGHHVQNQLGVSQQVQAMRGRLSEVEYNDLSVRLELQADCYAGVWAHHAQTSRQILEAGDIEEGIRAASAIGDDRLQKQSQGYVVPDAFTHGTSEQRVRWFTKGLKSGDPDQGDTFNAETL
jgi:hypothetical protein